jgi:DNA-binding PadR family transcriptional regulator
VPTTIPALGYALLGLLQQKPSSGYELRKMFSSTSLRTYSDSPGAIYPALQRLEKQGLIRGTIEDSSGLRRKQIFHVTSKGLTELKQWITRPVTREDLIWGESEVLLRFAFSESVAGRSGAIELLRSLEIALNNHVPELHSELNQIRSIKGPTSGRLAFECGVEGYEHLLHWTQRALASYEKERKGASS